MTEPKYATAAGLTAARAVRTVDVKLDDGTTVKVRGLSRRELMEPGADLSSAEIEVHNVSVCLVKPAMTDAQVRTWQANPDSIRDFARVTIAIRDLSGLGQGADKSDVDAPGDGA